jgi:hypothetical protein
LGGRGRQISEFKTSLEYRVSSKTAKAILRNPVSKNNNNKKKTKPKQQQQQKKNEPIHRLLHRRMQGNEIV